MIDYSITFLEFDMVDRRHWRNHLGEYRFYPIPIKSVADILEVKISDIYEAFKSWKENDFELDFKYKIEEKKYLEIWYNPNAEYFILGGYIRLCRPWGNHWRVLMPYRNIGFSLELLI